MRPRARPFEAARGECGPAGLVTSADAAAGISAGILIEQWVIFPAWIAGGTGDRRRGTDVGR